MSTFGPAYDAKTDGQRLKRQHERIRDYCLKFGWVTLPELAGATGYPEASISAQLRHLRKPQFGGYKVEKKRAPSAGLWEYRVSLPIVERNGQLAFA